MSDNNSIQQYGFWVRLASAFAVIAAASMILVKLYAWYQTDSAAMLASLTDSFFDVTASIINFFVIRYALMPADQEHRFGHGKAESLAGLAQAAFILGSAVLLILHSVERIKNPHPIQRPEIAVYATIFAIVITLLLVVVQYQALKRTQSVAIKADSLHYRGDILMNLGVLLAVWLSSIGYNSVDGWMAIGVALYLIWSAREIALESAAALMDKELPEQFTQQITSIVKQHPLVYGVHDIRTRQSGPTKFIQFHLELHDQMSLFEAHEVADKVEASIIREIPEAEVLIHQDPISVVNK